MPPRTKKPSAKAAAAAAAAASTTSKRAAKAKAIDNADAAPTTGTDSNARQPFGASKSHQQLPTASPAKKKSSHASKSKPKANDAKPKPQEPVGLPEDQIQSFLDNFDLEAEHRISVARRTLDFTLSSLRRQLTLTVLSRLPRSARLLTMREFIEEYGADVKEVVGSAARRMVQEGMEKGGMLDEGYQKAREEARAKRKGEDEGRTDGKKKAAPTKEAATRRTKASKKAGPSNSGSRPGAAAAASSSSVRPPSSATFAPQLGQSSGVPALPPTPAGAKGRLARTGEKVQWLSLNGSPITGIIGPDGVVRALPKTSGKKRAKGMGIDEGDGEDKDGDGPSGMGEDESQLLALAQKLRMGSGGAGGTGASSSSILHSSSPAKTRKWLAQRGVASAMVSSSAPSTPGGADSESEGMTDGHAKGGYGTAEEEDSPYSDEDEDDGELPDEAAYTAKVLAAEQHRRQAKAASSNKSGASKPPISRGAGGSSSSTPAAPQASSSGGNKANNGRSSGSSSSTSTVGRSSKSKSKSQTSVPPVKMPISRSATSTGPARGGGTAKRISILYGNGEKHDLASLTADDVAKIEPEQRLALLKLLQSVSVTDGAGEL